MKGLIIASALGLTACASTPAPFDNQFARGELAVFIADDFDTNRRAADMALRSSYEKYGAPHAYISGYMSSVDMPDVSRLYGSGDVRSKLRLDTHIFWQLDGASLAGFLEPIQTAYLVYDTDKMDKLTEVLASVGTLSARGKVFTVFERELDGQIVVTLHRTDDLPPESTLEALQFYSR